MRKLNVISKTRNMRSCNTVMSNTIKTSRLNSMIELCHKADIDVRGKVTDTKPLLEACERTRRSLAKNMGKQIASMADRRNVVQFNTEGMQNLIDEIMKRINTIDGIVGLLHKIAAGEKRQVVDIRRYLSHSGGEETDSEDSDIIEEYGGNEHRSVKSLIGRK